MSSLLFDLTYIDNMFIGEVEESLVWKTETWF